jgi:hypothetical protein
MRKVGCLVAAFALVVLLTSTWNKAASVQDTSLGLASGGDVDSDGDGLTDAQETKGWKVVVDFYGFGKDATGEHLVTWYVTSDPNVPDEDGDGLNDAEEYGSRTDPDNPDTDGDGLMDGEERKQWLTSPVSVDSDGDCCGPLKDRVPNQALFDGRELLELGTSPTLDDTDGDGRTDYEEFGDPEWSPLIAEIPRLEVDVNTVVDVRLDVQYAEEVGSQREYGGALTTSKTDSQSFSHTESLEMGVTLGWEADASITGGVKQNYEFSITASASVSFEEESSKTLEKSYSDYTTDSRILTEMAATGSMTMGVLLKNTGPIAYTVSQLGFTVRMWKPGDNPADPNAGGSFQTVCTLTPELNNITLAPGDVTPLIMVKASNVSASRIKDLLARPDTLYLEPALYSIKDAGGNDFSYLKAETARQTARFIIDPGQNTSEEYCVATNVQRTSTGELAGVRMDTILHDILDIDFAVDPASPAVLDRIRDVRNYGDPIKAPRAGWGRWQVYVTRKTPVDEPTNVDFNDITIKAGDEVLLWFECDDDGDGVYKSVEQHYGTSDVNSPDTDEDGLTDFEEVSRKSGGWTVSVVGREPYRIWSDPRQKDQDGDTWNDSVEKSKGTDPTIADTDGDGLVDSVDQYPLRMNVLFVKPAGTGDGSSWDNSASLPGALAKARDLNGNNNPGDDITEIWVAQGTYRPSDPGATVSFELVSKARIYGGFKGVETTRQQRDRDPQNNGTVLSGGKTVVHAGPGITSAAVLDGFTIRDAAGESGIVCEGGTPRLVNLLVKLNTCSNPNEGGAGARIITNAAGEMVLSNCVFRENTADAGFGGGLYVDNHGDASKKAFRVTLQGCEFILNKCLAAKNGGGGGGACFWYVAVGLDRCRFVQNAAQLEGGGVDLEACTASVLNCTFSENSVITVADEWGQDMYAGGGMFVNCSTVAIGNSIFWNNAACNGGGLFFFWDSPFSIINSSIVDNHDAKVHTASNSHSGGIKIKESSKKGYVRNSILYGNVSMHYYRTDYPWLLQICDHGSYGKLETVVLENCCVEGAKNIGSGVIADDPSFVSQTGGNLRLAHGSPCIDRGDDGADWDPLEMGLLTRQKTDIDGHPRVVDGDTIKGAKVDLGAYEYQVDQ